MRDLLRHVVMTKNITIVAFLDVIYTYIVVFSLGFQYSNAANNTIILCAMRTNVGHRWVYRDDVRKCHRNIYVCMCVYAWYAWFAFKYY